jgi:hypothetical protein
MRVVVVALEVIAAVLAVIAAVSAAGLPAVSAAGLPADSVGAVEHPADLLVASAVEAVDLPVADPAAGATPVRS